MKPRYWIRTVACGPLMLLALGGCDDGRPPRVPVSGQVLIDGEPLHCGYIQFIPSNARPSGSEIDRDGRFRLSCFEEFDGAVPGRHRVRIIATEVFDEVATCWYIPKKHADPATSGLEQVIEEPTDSLVIHLTWDGGKPFFEVEPPEFYQE